MPASRPHSRTEHEVKAEVGQRTSLRGGYRASGGGAWRNFRRRITEGIVTGCKWLNFLQR
jgi:hypothetical protein